MHLDKNKISHIPSTIGIYIFRAQKTPIYIGKSVNLKARVKSHIENAKIDAKEASIIENADSIDYIVTDSEFKALLLESKLIQKYLPKYNVRWRDDKSYLYIKVTVKEPYPKLFITRKEDDPAALFFGPFASVTVATNILREIRKVFPFCTQKQLGKRHCFYAKIKQCNPCPSDIEKMDDGPAKSAAKREYRRNVRNVIRVLEGKTDLVVKHLYDQLELLKRQENYEEAILYRDRLLRLEGVVLRRSFDMNSIENYNQSEKRVESLMRLLSKHFAMTRLERIECYDMSTLAFQDSTASMVVFTEGLSNKREYKRFKIKDAQAESDFEMLSEVLHRRFKNSWPHPDLMIVDGGKPQVRTAQKVLRELQLDIPLIGIAKRPDRIVVGDDSLTFLKPPRVHPGFQLVQALRDESHRFAKKYHLHLRNKKVL